MKMEGCLEMESSPYLDCFLDIDARFSYGYQQLIEPSHLLDEDSVHALGVGCWVSPHGSLDIEVVWKFTQDISSHLIYHFIG